MKGLWKACVIGLIVLFILSSFLTGCVDRTPEKKHTGLNILPAEAYKMWKADPERVIIIDVRTPEEYAYVGHPPMAYNIPTHFHTWEYDPEKKEWKMKANPDFVKEVMAKFDPKVHTLILLCRSAVRSCDAIIWLEKAGWPKEKLYNVLYGFEGPKSKRIYEGDEGWRTLPGSWRYERLPWTYDLDPKLMYKPK